MAPATQPMSSPAGREEAALRESEARYRSALTAGRMGSWETDLVAKTRTWSAEGMALFGLDLRDGRGQVGGAGDEYQAALHPEDRHLAEEFHRLADRQDAILAEYRIVRPDGTTLWLSGRGLVVARLADGRAHRLVSIMADVSERRQAEEGLRIERERLALALQAGQMGVYDYDMVNDKLWWAPQTYALFGVSPSSFVPTPESVAALIHPDDRAAFVQRRKEALAQKRPLLLEFRVVRPDGNVLWIGHRGHAEYDAAGRPLRSFGISLDITERKQSEQALRDADRLKDNFIATLAHELRNPLAPIRNALGVLRQQPPSDSQVAWCRDILERQVGQMSRLLEDLLDVARLSRGKLTLRREPLDFAAVVAHAIEIADPVIEEGGHVLEVTMPTSPIGVEGDLARLAQVFSNLLINAAKYTRHRGRIVLTIEPRGGEVVTTVEDDGIGIAAGQMPTIFEMFGQADAALDRSQGGLGIGLSLARGVVEMHGGDITARSDGLGKGSAFIVRLPMTAATSPATDSGGSLRAAPAPASAGLRIVVADDLHDSADTLAAFLRGQGHEVRVAYDGEQALRSIESFRPDVALLDLGMPKLNGYDLCRRIRALPWGGATQLIAQSGWGQAEDRRRSADAGFDHHIVKPLDLDRLEALLRARSEMPCRLSAARSSRRSAAPAPRPAPARISCRGRARRPGPATGAPPRRPRSGSPGPRRDGCSSGRPCVRCRART